MFDVDVDIDHGLHVSVNYLSLTSILLNSRRNIRGAAEKTCGFLFCASGLRTFFQFFPSTFPFIFSFRLNFILRISLLFILFIDFEKNIIRTKIIIIINSHNNDSNNNNINNKYCTINKIHMNNWKWINKIIIELHKIQMKYLEASLYVRIRLSVNAKWPKRPQTHLEAMIIKLRSGAPA